MIRSLCTAAAAVALTAAGIVAASSATAGPAPSAAAKQAGYVAVPQEFHSARVTLRVPALHCTHTSPNRTLRLGLFASEAQAGVVRPVSLSVEAICTDGAARYRAVYRNHGAAGGMHVHRGDVVALELDGIQGYSVEDKTTGAGSGGAEGETGPGATKPKAERPVLIGVQWVGPRPTRVQGAFRTSLVDHTKLAKVAHHKHGNAATSRVGALHGGRFQVTFAPKHAG